MAGSQFCGQNALPLNFIVFKGGSKKSSKGSGTQYEESLTLTAPGPGISFLEFGGVNLLVEIRVHFEFVSFKRALRPSFKMICTLGWVVFQNFLKCVDA
jgi:hypothetical protein